MSHVEALKAQNQQLSSQVAQLTEQLAQQNMAHSATIAELVQSHQQSITAVAKSYSVMLTV